MKKFSCSCGNTVYFENLQCLSCRRVLGFLPDMKAMSAFEKGEGTLWRSLLAEADSGGYSKCRNYEKEDVCNWMVPAAEGKEYCFSCRLTRMIPDLTQGENRKLWFRMERAKRRLLYTVLVFGLPLVGRAEDNEGGLAFDFLEDSVFTSKVMTGHSKGVITINLAEADPSAREEIREQMKERYRTLLGHFRHEIAHYYWDRLLWGTPDIEEFRLLFGDERQDYQQAIGRHYRQGPPDDWRTSFISAYATMHPWEDWAETWSHYMHIVDTLETAHEWGIGFSGTPVSHPASTMQEGAAYAASYYIPPFDEVVEDWVNLTLVLNALNRSMGMPDPYPFILSDKVIEKLHFVHDIIRKAIT